MTQHVGVQLLAREGWAIRCCGCGVDGDPARREVAPASLAAVQAPGTQVDEVALVVREGRLQRDRQRHPSRLLGHRIGADQQPTIDGDRLVAVVQHDDAHRQRLAGADLVPVGRQSQLHGVSNGGLMDQHRRRGIVDDVGAEWEVYDESGMWRRLGELFTDRLVVGIHAVDLVLGFGTLHCLTQQQPA